MQLITSLREIRRLITRPEVFNAATSEDDPEDYTPNPSGIYFKLDSGVVWYEPCNDRCEMVSALTGLPSDPVQVVKDQWSYLSSLGYREVYANVKKQNLRSAIMCRVLGMSKECQGDVNIYSKVIGNG